ncbi:hypothetical protein FF124_09480 [Martelella lutilitoris]|uniref:Uncharacterized protein n=1 Tax=Martelella lutilitoris TaxID=2583532 RepID=A0A5C4JQY3_9HYPH|nr:hypothetical protein [Martelella lutilitoris]TNB47816.1 hypothetical protein FF124_09480 [Martelella lutilitoris]
MHRIILPFLVVQSEDDLTTFLAVRYRFDIDSFQEGAKDMRLLNCHYCGHHLRFGPAVCTACSMPTPLANRSRFWAKVLLGTVVALVAALFVLVF